MKNRLSIILTILLIAMSVIFVFMGKDIMELKNSNELSVEAIQTLQTENKQLQDNIATLENDKKVLKRQVDDLVAEKTQLEDKVKELSIQKTTTVSESKETNQQQTTQKKEKKTEQTASKQNNDEKIAYLTFDDGPSVNTVKILDILKQYNIKATFFVNGNASMKNLYKRIVNEGHSIGNHTYSHNYKSIYSSVDEYIADMNKLNNLLKETTGVTPTIVRFPGGSNNTVSIKYGGEDIMKEIVKKVVNMGYQYFDWNVSSTDAEKVKQDKDIIVKSALDGAKNKNKIVVLMHDVAAKTTTVEALPEIIEGLIKQGFKFESLDKDSYAPHFLKID
jgi:peptidoglycan/xylan/chitin deacetylase (PgdA/CDA1 family)